jgi:hypothetical protein
LLEGKNDVVRCNRWQRYKFIVNVAWTMFHDASRVEGSRSSSFSPSTPMPSSPCIITFAVLLKCPKIGMSLRGKDQQCNPQFHSKLDDILMESSYYDRNYTAMRTHMRRSVHLSALLIT